MNTSVFGNICARAYNCTTKLYMNMHAQKQNMSIHSHTCAGAKVHPMHGFERYILLGTQKKYNGHGATA